jgi:hypothetical protein
MNEWRRETARAQCRRTPLDIYPDGSGLIGGARWPRHSYRAESGGTKRQPGSAPAEKSFQALAPLATPLPSAHGLRKRSLSGSSAGLRRGSPGSSRAAYEDRGIYCDRTSFFQKSGNFRFEPADVLGTRHEQERSGWMAGNSKATFWLADHRHHALAVQEVRKKFCYTLLQFAFTLGVVNRAMLGEERARVSDSGGSDAAVSTPTDIPHSLSSHSGM